ncbi:hypothetical protein [Propionibacterium freudenreichii]|uniref:hypothetical protein n=1 Tax=Propionibacterium freudenreichii TaxID=1744 RepID=UPI00254A89F0|nr:hypothetical protein [Propionibacterium freudenreichii]MDK9342157.1 hypothetical protein [Propionibacterium freudenreichii]
MSRQEISDSRFLDQPSERVRRAIDTARATARHIDPCPALHVIAGRALATDRQPRHALGVDGRCRHCHTTIPTIKGDTA